MRREAVRSILESVLGGPLPRDDRLIEGGVIGSLALVEIIVGLEKRFEITIDFADVDRSDFEAVDRIVGMIERLEASQK